MELFTVGYEGRTLPQLVRILKEHEITRLVDVRHRPASRKRGSSALALFEELRRSGITYESDRLLGNPDEIRELWKNGESRGREAPVPKAHPHRSARPRRGAARPCCGGAPMRPLLRGGP